MTAHMPVYVLMRSSAAVVADACRKLGRDTSTGSGEANATDTS